jgi:hypothetical protein
MFINIYKINRKRNFNDYININLLHKYKILTNINHDIINRGNYGTVNIVNKYYISKTFSNNTDYNNEKKIYTTKLPRFIGTLINDGDNLYYNNNILFPECENNKIIIRDNFMIKDIIKIISKNIDTIYIDVNKTMIFINLENKFLNIGFCVKDNDKYNLYIDNFKIMRLHYFNDSKKILYYENLGDKLSFAYKNIYPSLEQRIFLCIDLIRQVSELIDISIYHNDIKNDNIVIKFDINYYINLIDYGISVSIDDLLNFDYLTTAYSLSPEYYIINKILKNKKPNITNLINNLVKIFPNNNDVKIFLDKSMHWAIGGIIINILSWKDVQYPIWKKNYNPNKYEIGYDITFIEFLNKYSVYDIAFNYTTDMLCALFKNSELYNDSFYFSDDIIIELNLNIKKIEEYSLIKDLIDEKFKEEYIDLLLIIHNLFEFNTENKMPLSVMYDMLKDYPGYKEYLLSKPSFI